MITHNYTTSDAAKNQRLVVRAIRSLTATLQQSCKDLILAAKLKQSDDGARTFLIKWVSQLTSESFVDWLANDPVVKGWIQANLAVLVEASHKFWVIDKAHPLPYETVDIFQIFIEGDYLYLAHCLQERGDGLRAFITLLCRFRMKQELERYRSPATFQIRSRATTEDGDVYTFLSKLVPPISWAFNGNGVRAVNGDNDISEFTKEVFVPRTYSIVPRGARRKPYQEILPFTVAHDDDLGVSNLRFSLLADSVDNAAMVFGEKAAKLVCVMFSSAPLFGGVAVATLGELAQQVLPDSKRVQARDYREVVASLRAIRDLLLVIDNDTDLQLFTVSCPIDPNTAHKTQRVSWAFSEQTRLALAGEFQHIKGKSLNLNGWFLVNYTRLMRIPGRYVRAISMYLRIAALWNTCKDHETGAFLPDRQKRQSLDDFLIQCDALSPRTIAYLSDPNPKDQVGLCARLQDRKGGKVLLNVLVEYGLIESWECPDDPNLVYFVPTARDLEAIAKSHASSNRSQEAELIAN